jgi:tRNA-2-methylthio-N6-dimethylallyladenosine synthase
MTSHPKDVSDELIRAVGECERIAPHFHLPLQSGSNRILAKMNRRYDTERYLSVVEKLRAARPGIALTSDIIVGFPGESDADFEQTLSMLSRVRFDMIYSFIYSARKGTPAALYPDQVPHEISAERMRRLLELQGEIARECNLPHVGKILRVLVDEPSKDGRSGILSGRTDTGKLVHFAPLSEEIGRYASVRIDRAEAFALYGTEIPTASQ